MKSFLKSILVAILGNQVRRLRQKNNFKIIGVVGSIGKTSTKLAIAKVLSSHYRVRYQEGNYNDIVSVPLVFFGHQMPSLWNVFSWLSIIFQNEVQIFFKYPFDLVVVELGTDGPGQIAQFRKYLKLDISVITAITPEHMEFFGTIQNVAEEEWSVSYFSDLVYVNRDLCTIVPENIDHQKIFFYGKGFGSLYKIENITRNKDGFDFDIYHEGKNMISLFYETVSETSLYSVCAAVVVAQNFKTPEEKIKLALKSLTSFAGRMQKLEGKQGAVIIDDTYNASPEAMKLALDTLYDYPLPNKIAILGSMNELGESSNLEHQKVGEYCDPTKLNLVVTLGQQANKFLAPAAQKKGCTVYEARDAADAGLFVLEKMSKDTVILAKGSQNGVFAEEALKPLLKNKSDYSKLVRQDKVWLSKKSIDF